MTPVPTTSSARPLFLAAVLLGVEAAAALAFGAAEVAQIRVSRAVVGAGTAILMLGYGAFLAVAARGVWRGRRWSRGPAVAFQLLHLPIAWSFRDGQTSWVALSLATVSVLTLVCLLLPSSTRVFVPDVHQGRSTDQM